MSHIDFGNDLTITDVPEGIILQWVATDTAVIDTFTLKMSPGTVLSLKSALDKAHVGWTNEDGSLNVSGGAASLLLTFQMSEPPFERRALRLDGTDAARFRAEISKRADHTQM